MRLATKFNEFLSNEVNLNKTRLDTLDARTGSVTEFLRASAYGAKIRGFTTQGSYAHKTIIKPAKTNGEFDADMVIYLSEKKDWEAQDYIEELYKVFRANGTYRSKVSRKSRCVTIDYAGDFHLDVVPITVREHYVSKDSFRVCNRHDNDFELSDGDGFKDWWLEKDQQTTNHRLTKVARLLKYLRDTKTTFSCKSVLLTTLIGQQVSSWKDYPDVPTTLKMVIEGIDDFLQANETMSDIKNPALNSESFTRNWSQEQYTNFRSAIHRYRGWIQEAFDEPNRNESIRKWRRVFGDGFAKDVVLEEASTAAVAKSLLTNSNSQDPISMLRLYGRELFSRFPRALPHVRLHTLREESTQTVRISTIRKDHLTSPGGGKITSGSILPANINLQFRATNAVGAPFPPNEYKVEWLVANTGDDARSSRGLRGEYESSSPHGYRDEHTLYHGIHFVEAVVINQRRRRIVGRSERFFVVIDTTV